MPVTSRAIADSGDVVDIGPAPLKALVTEAWEVHWAPPAVHTTIPMPNNALEATSLRHCLQHWTQPPSSFWLTPTPSTMLVEQT